MSVESLFGRPLVVVNLGLEVFAADLLEAGVRVVHMDWRPPAGDARTAALLAALDDSPKG